MPMSPLIKMQSTMEPNMQDILYAFWMTIELWVFLGILCLAMAAEGIIQKLRNKTVDNPSLR